MGFLTLKVECNKNLVGCDLDFNEVISTVGVLAYNGLQAFLKGVNLGQGGGIILGS